MPEAIIFGFDPIPARFSYAVSPKFLDIEILMGF